MAGINLNPQFFRLNSYTLAHNHGYVPFGNGLTKYPFLEYKYCSQYQKYKGFIDTVATDLEDFADGLWVLKSIDKYTFIASWVHLPIVPYQLAYLEEAIKFSKLLENSVRQK